MPTQLESKQGIDQGIEKAWDPSALNTQEVSVVDIFAESYNPSMPGGGWWGGSWQFKDDTARKKAKKKLEDKLRFAQQSVLSTSKTIEESKYNWNQMSISPLPQATPTQKVESESTSPSSLQKNPQPTSDNEDELMIGS